jgi:hypothetical protein
MGDTNPGGENVVTSTGEPPIGLMKTIEAATKSESFLSKRRVRWAGLAALFGCSVVCALPMLVAAGIGGGAAAAIARLLRPGAELVVAGVLFSGALGFMALRFRAKSRAGLQGGCCRSARCLN